MNTIPEKLFQKKFLALAILAPAMALTACGGGSSSSDSGQATSGVAFDGYLRNATVCVDENLNKVCDPGEPSAKTGPGGQYTIEGLTEKQSKLPVVLEARAGETIDEDTISDENPDGTTVVDEFSFSAPAGSKTISPFSTIIQAKKERLIASGETVAEAERLAKRELATDLGVDPELDLANYDPIAQAKAGTGVDTENQDAKKLQIVSRILTRNLAETLQDPVLANSANRSAGLLLAVEKVAAKASAIKASVDAAVQQSGTSPTDLSPEQVNEVLETVSNDPSAKPDPVSQEELTEAEADVEKSKQALEEAAEPEQEGTGGTGATG